ncbi:MAG: bacteriorhodopsin [Halobacteriales archaeon]
MPEIVADDMASGLVFVWLALGFVGTALGSIAFLGAGWTEPDPWKRQFYHYATAAAGAMAVAYLLALFGIGRIAIGAGEGVRPVFWARILAWVGVGPVFLFAIGRLGNASWTQIKRAVVLGAGVSVATLLAILIQSGALSLAIWGFAVASLVGVLGLLFGPIGSAASRRHQTVAATYRRSRNTLAIALALSLAVGVGGGTGFDVLSGGTALPLYFVSDVVGVVLVGFFLCRSRAVLHSARPTDTVDSGAAENSLST